ncbi:MAG TPA: glycosyltransferase family 4 protein [Vicinamibacteria bacterium]
MNVLHVTPFYEPGWGYGGMARAAVGLCRGLARAGHQVTVATALLDEAHPREERAEGMRVCRFPSIFGGVLVPWAPALGRFLEAELPATDLVHLHGHRNGLAVTAASLSRAAGVPYVLQPHGTFPHHGQRRLAKAVFDALWGGVVVGRAAAVVAVSVAEAAELPRAADVVANGVEPPPLPRSPRRAEGASLLFVGSDRPQKRAWLLPQLLTAVPEARLELVGRYGARFRRGLRRFADRVRVTGVVDPAGVGEAYARADLVVHPAVGEAFGLVPFEAALAGVPAVVAGGHGCGEWFGRAGGCVVPPDDSNSLIDAVRVRLADRERAQAEARAVAAFTRRELTWDRAAAALTALYEAFARRPAA